ncbi:muts domain V-domain-containing protein [Hyaloraphidium curvatum]|nr:muts domain V-domain-containing protein [Hyaloraphidium curvatum]
MTVSWFRPIRTPGTSCLDCLAQRSPFSLSLRCLATDGAAEALPTKRRRARGAGPAKAPSIFEQLIAVQDRHPDSVILFQIGDFYEIYSRPKDKQDQSRHAHDLMLDEASSILGLRITTKEGEGKTKTARMAGFPLASRDANIRKLLEAGLRVAVYDQVTQASETTEGPDVAETPALSPPTASRATITRTLTEAISPGVVMDEAFLDPKQSNYLLAISASSSPLRSTYGLAWIDVSTGQFTVGKATEKTITLDIARLQPSEVLVPNSFADQSNREWRALRLALQKCGLLGEGKDFVTARPASAFGLNDAKELVAKHLGPEADLSIEKLDALQIQACGALLGYVAEAQGGRHLAIHGIDEFNPAKCMRLDPSTVRSLELLQPLKSDSGSRSKAWSLVSVLDETLTAPGARLLRSQIRSPSTDADEIERKLDLVEFFLRANDPLVNYVADRLRSTSDVERTLGRISMERGGPYDMAVIALTLRELTSLRNKLLGTAEFVAVRPDLVSKLHDFSDLVERLQPLVARDDSLGTEDGASDASDDRSFLRNLPRKFELGMVAPGISKSLDDERAVLADLYSERDKLTVSLELMAGLGRGDVQLDYSLRAGPFVFVRKQKAPKFQSAFPSAKRSRADGEFAIKEWTALHGDISRLEMRCFGLEKQIMIEAFDEVIRRGSRIIESCSALAHLDVAWGLAKVAKRFGYVRPTIDRHGTSIAISEGRHPVVEAAMLERNQGTFVPNSCSLDDSTKILFLTGPNMGGKSTFLRQCAIIQILAQVGSFVPAKSAHLCIVDRVFTRIGASDDLASNQSTFMVEMVEAAEILHHATERSLAVIDELGRGTSTKDGISLAYAVIQYLHDHSRCNTLFATHLHELAELVFETAESGRASSLPKLACFRTALHERSDGTYLFDYRVVPGIVKHSHGINVARIAGLPADVIEVANQVHAKLDEMRYNVLSSRMGRSG